MIARMSLRRFTTFEELDFEPSSGINVLIGVNGTGKTHLMKIAYAACDVSKTGDNFIDKLNRVFLPSGRSVGRLVKKKGRGSTCEIKVFRHNRWIDLSFSSHLTSTRGRHRFRSSVWDSEPVTSAYIPVEEMLSNAPGFRSLYAQREVHFEEIHDDILSRAYSPILRGPLDRKRQMLLAQIAKLLSGTIRVSGEECCCETAKEILNFPCSTKEFASLVCCGCLSRTERSWTARCSSGINRRQT